MMTATTTTSCDFRPRVHASRTNRLCQNATSTTTSITSTAVALLAVLFIVCGLTVGVFVHPATAAAAAAAASADAVDVDLDVERGASAEWITTASGQRIPLEEVRQYVLLPRHSRSRARSREFLSRAVYELVNDTHLVSASESIEIGRVSPARGTLAWGRGTALSLNGVRLKHSSPTAAAAPLLQTGERFAFVRDGRTRALIAGWGPGLLLHPLHPARYPNLFVNSAQSTAPSPSSSAAAAARAQSSHRQPDERSFGPTSLLSAGMAQYDAEEVSSTSTRISNDERVIITTTTQSSPSTMAVNSKMEMRMMMKCNEDDTLTLEVAVAYDASFCALYGNSREKANMAVQALFARVSDVYTVAPAPCIRVRVISIDAYCAGDDNGSQDASDTQAFRKPSALLRACEKKKGQCSPAAELLRYVANEWHRSVSAKAHRDAVVFFSGYGIHHDDDDDSRNETVPSQGAAYFKAVCNGTYAFAWVQGANIPVLAHEIGHLLGAPHDVAGVMRNDLNTTAMMTTNFDNIDNNNISSPSSLVLSAASAAAISTFVDTDIRSWCLRRNYATFGKLQRKYAWTPPSVVVTYRKQDPKTVEGADDDEDSRSDGPVIDVADMSFGHILSSNATDLLILLTTTTRKRKSRVILEYLIKPALKCEGKAFCNPQQGGPTTRHKLPLSFSFPAATTKAFGAAVGHISLSHRANSTSDSTTASPANLVISYVSQTGQGPSQAYYLVGGSIGTDGGAPVSWSRAHRVKPFSASDVRASALTLHALRGGGGGGGATKNLDLVLAWIDMVPPTQGGPYMAPQASLRYCVGFGVSAEDGVKGGWSEMYEAPGYFGGDPSGVGVTLLDLDGNGRPELIVFYADGAPAVHAGFLRVGRDVDDAGRVTGGWSDFARVSSLVSYATRAGTMAVTRLGGGPGGGSDPSILTVAAILRDTTLFQDVWSLYFGTRVLTPGFVASTESRPLPANASAVYSVSGARRACAACYPSGAASTTCLTAAARCATSNAVVSDVAKGSLPLSLSSSVPAPFSAGAGTLPPPAASSRSLFCVGLGDMLRRTGIAALCAAGDVRTITANGIRHAFMLALRAEDDSLDEANVYSEVVTSSPVLEAGSSSNAAPSRGNLAARFVIISKDELYTNVVKRASKRFNDLKGNVEGIKIVVTRVGNRWIVRFFFSKKHQKEFT